MKSLLTLLLMLPFAALAAEVELRIHSKWISDTASNEISTTVKAKIGKSKLIPLDSTPNMYLRMTVNKKKSSKDLLLQTELIEMKNGKEKVVSRPRVETKIGSEASIESERNDESLKISIIPTKILGTF